MLTIINKCNAEQERHVISSDYYMKTAIWSVACILLHYYKFVVNRIFSYVREGSGLPWVPEPQRIKNKRRKNDEKVIFLSSFIFFLRLWYPG